MSQLFNGSTSKSVHTNIGSGFSYGTLVQVVKRANTSWASMSGFHNSGGTGVVGMLCQSTDLVSWFDQSALKFNSSISNTSSTGWALDAVTKATGTTSPRIHQIRTSGGVWDVAGTAQHLDNTVGTIADRTAQTGGTFQIGVIDSSDFFNGRMAVTAYKANATPLTDSEIESLVTTFTRANWLSLGMTFLVDANDAFATDYAGATTQSVATALTSDADDPPGWASWAGAAAVDLPHLVMAPPRPA